MTYDLRGNISNLIRLNFLNIRSEIWPLPFTPILMDKCIVIFFKNTQIDMKYITQWSRMLLFILSLSTFLAKQYLLKTSENQRKVFRGYRYEKLVWLISILWFFIKDQYMYHNSFIKVSLLSNFHINIIFLFRVTTKFCIRRI